MARPPKKRPAGDYEVGYGRPPPATQFKKGQPRPPRKAKDEKEPTLDDYIAEELKLPMRFQEEGQERRMPKGKVLAKMAVNKAIKDGDLRRLRDHLPKRQAAAESEFSEADLELIARFLANWQAGEGGDK